MVQWNITSGIYLINLQAHNLLAKKYHVKFILYAVQIQWMFR